MMDNEQLVARIQAGKNISENMLQLWQQNQGLIKTIANKYTAFAEMDDLLQEGYIGLCNATYGYDPKEGMFFNYAALWVRQAMQRYIENNGSGVRISSYSHQNIINYNKAQEKFRKIYGRDASDKEMQRYLGLSKNKYDVLMKAVKMQRCFGLDGERFCNDEDDSCTLLDMIPGGSQRGRNCSCSN